MDQKKIGVFLKELRKESGFTQEQLSEKLGVSNRSVSRWENGSNMPDFDMVIEMANLYDVTIEELLDGERKENMIEKEEETTLLKVAEYENESKIKYTKRIRGVLVAALIAQMVPVVVNIMEWNGSAIGDAVSGFCMGLVWGILLVAVLFSTRYGAKIKAFKMRLLKRSEE